jgi:hypothetical protein
MRGLLWLYPREWRRRYGREMEAVLVQTRPRPEDALDLLAGALDARLHPQWRRRGPGARWLAALGLVVAAALASHAVTVALGAADAVALRLSPSPGIQLLPSGQLLAPLLLIPAWLVAGLGWRWLGERFLAGFCGLLAVRFAADWLLLPLAVGHVGMLPGGLAVIVAANVVQVAAWGVFAVLVLRRTPLPLPAAFAAGCALELLLGSAGPSPGVLLEQAWVVVPRWSAGWTSLPGYVEPLRIALWAAVLAALAARRRRCGPWTEPPEGAPVGARPAPDPPQLLDARARRAS